MNRSVKNWGAILAWLQERPGRWSLHPDLTAVPRSVVRVVRLRQTQVLRNAPGRLEFFAQNEWLDPVDDRRKVDLYLRWRPR